MKKVALVFEATDKELEKSLPFTSTTHFTSYTRFIATAREISLDVRICFIHLYKGKSFFTGSFSFTNGDPIWSPEDFQADCIVIRSHKFSKMLDGSENVINRLQVIDAALDKATTYKLFSEYMLPTLELDRDRGKEQIDQIPGEFIVCKPRSGYGGAGIYIGPKADFVLPTDPEQGYILQQFLDTSKGIPGITSGIHDLRIILSGHEPISFVRIPKPGSLLANLSQGGEARALSYGEIPKSALKIARIVEEKISPDFPHFYCADFFFSPEGKPYLCELNSQPGFTYDKAQGPEFVAKYHKTLLAVIKDALAQPN